MKIGCSRFGHGICMCYKLLIKNNFTDFNTGSNAPSLRTDVILIVTLLGQKTLHKRNFNQA